MYFARKEFIEKSLDRFTTTSWYVYKSKDWC